MTTPSYPSNTTGQSAGMPTNTPLSAPLYGASPKQAVQRFFRKYADFTGRASRSEYWWWWLASFIVGVICYAIILVGAVPGTTTINGQLYRTSVPGPLSFVGIAVLILWGLATIVPNLALLARRLHDANFTGWLMLLSLIPFVGGLIVFVMTLLPPNPQGQRFDAPAAGFRA